MPFPTNSRRTMALGREGTRASDNPVVYATGQLVASAGGVKAAAFVWPTAPAETNDIYSPVTLANTGAGAPLGIAEANIQSYITGMEDASMVILEGHGVQVIKKGDVFMKTATEATVGQSVFAVLADGTVKTGAKGATIAGAVETDFTVRTAGKADEIIFISNW